MAVIHSLPLFPLNVVLYPGEQLPLHIFEARYQELTRFCLAEEVPFGIVLAEDGEIAEVGSTARIMRIITRYEDGRMDLLVAGQERFRIHQLHDERAYLTADVKMLEERTGPIEPTLRERIITQHMKLLELVGRTVRPGVYDKVDHLAYALAQDGGLDARQKQRVLEMTSENERIAFLVQHFEALIPRIQEQEVQRRRIQSNGHFDLGKEGGGKGEA